jgi:hypothetical protein
LNGSDWRIANGDWKINGSDWRIANGKNGGDEQVANGEMAVKRRMGFELRPKALQSHAPVAHRQPLFRFHRGSSAESK